MQKTTLLILLIVTGISGMTQNNPVQWSFTSRKTADKTYEVTLSATVQSPWHIYSQATPDGGPVATTITYNKNPLLTMDGNARESGKIITKHEEVFGVDVIYFDGRASFVQTVKLKSNAKTNLSGKIRFMACNDEQCLSPAEVAFNVTLQ